MTERVSTQALTTPDLTALISGLNGHPRAPGQVQKIEDAARKMLKNTIKALNEHTKKWEEATHISPTACIAAIIDPAASLSSLTLSASVSSTQGYRPRMEDHHFCIEIEQGTLAGVLDGHGGSEVAEIASGVFQKMFSSALKSTNSNVHAAYEVLISTIHEHIALDPTKKYIGTTAVICFIEKGTNYIYTATLGDSEAHIYRKIDGRFKSIPLSCVRDWSSQKDATRAAIAWQMPDLVAAWMKAEDPKLLRFPHPQFGLNVSRAIGDVHHGGKGTVSHKPKITLNRLLPEDRLIIACDGLVDFVSPDEIIERLERNCDEATLATELVDYALHTKNSSDNITVLVLHATQ